MTSSSPLSTPSADEVLLVGRIAAPFGLHGQVKMVAITDQADHFRRRIHTIYIGPKLIAHKLQRVLQHKPGLLILSLTDIGSLEAAENLRGSEVFIHERDAAPLAADEYFIHQLYGIRVLTDTGEELGTVREVIETGANDVLVVARPGQSEVLIPMIREVVLDMNLEQGSVTVHLIDGLV